eukprot:4843808-Alexandrium_andersonii.AAC.1
MSASLVGSEMCIRDRSVASSASVLPSAAASPGADVAPPPSGPAACGGAVSYTHLTLPTICSV